MSWDRKRVNKLNRGFQSDSAAVFRAVGSNADPLPEIAEALDRYAEDLRDGLRLARSVDAKPELKARLELLGDAAEHLARAFDVPAGEAPGDVGKAERALEKWRRARRGGR